MKKINVLARINANNFVELAGHNYIGPNSQFIVLLNSENREGILGIKREDGVYTIIGAEYVYYHTSNGVKGQISHSEILKILKKNAWELRKHNKFEYLKLNDLLHIWIKDGPTMTAIWNTILLFAEELN